MTTNLTNDRINSYATNNAIMRHEDSILSQSTDDLINILTNLLHHAGLALADIIEIDTDLDTYRISDSSIDDKLSILSLITHIDQVIDPDNDDPFANFLDALDSDFLIDLAHLYANSNSINDEYFRSAIIFRHINTDALRAYAQ